MRTREDLAGELERLVQDMYYSEDFHLLSALRGWAAGLEPDEQAMAAQIAYQRLQEDGSLVDIILCTAFEVPGAGDVLAARLNREMETGQVTRALMTALRRYPSDDAYRAVSRFLDSDQDMDAVQALAAMDFVRTLPVLVSVLRHDHYLNIVLHILHERRKQCGMDRLLHELTGSTILQKPGASARFQEAVRSKDAPYNPFSADEIAAIVAALEPGRT